MQSSCLYGASAQHFASLQNQFHGHKLQRVSAMHTCFMMRIPKASGSARDSAQQKQMRDKATSSRHNLLLQILKPQFNCRQNSDLSFCVVKPPSCVKMQPEIKNVNKTPAHLPALQQSQVIEQTRERVAGARGHGARYDNLKASMSSASSNGHLPNQHQPSSKTAAACNIKHVAPQQQSHSSSVGVVELLVAPFVQRALGYAKPAAGTRF